MPVCTDYPNYKYIKILSHTITQYTLYPKIYTDNHDWLMDCGEYYKLEFHITLLKNYQR